MKEDTILVTAGRDPVAHDGVVNPPVYHASTILFPSVAAMHAAHKQPFDSPSYGRLGTATTFALEQAVAAAEGGYRSIAVSSGVAAINTVLMSFAKAGAHLLIADSVYFPTRRFCQQVLKPLGVTIDYFDPLIGGKIEHLIRPETVAVFLESPGSLTFEVQDVPAIATAAHEQNVAVILDNTWASPLFFKPFEHGVDISIQAATKYIVGHADVMLGTVTCTEKWHPKLWKTARLLGACPGPDDCYLALRGLRTLGVRLRQHQQNALHLARWLQQRPEVSRVLYPALPEDPGHAIWKRDFLGASGLFGVVLKPVSAAAVAAMLDDMEFFGIGESWGGYESLAIPTWPEKCRSAVPWETEGPCLRLHIGLEDVDDLTQDLERGFERLTSPR